MDDAVCGGVVGRLDVGVVDQDAVRGMGGDDVSFERGGLEAFGEVRGQDDGANDVVREDSYQPVCSSVISGER